MKEGESEKEKISPGYLGNKEKPPRAISDYNGGVLLVKKIQTKIIRYFNMAGYSLLGVSNYVPRYMNFCTIFGAISREQ